MESVVNTIITGRAGAGKTTYARRTKMENEHYGIKTIILDGDDVRIDFNVGYTDEDREEHIRRIGKITNILNRQGFNVLIPCVLPTKKLRKVLVDTIIHENIEMIYIEGGKLWEGTIYEEPTEDEVEGVFRVYNWRNPK